MADMLAVCLERFGIEGLQLRTQAMPEVGARQVLLRLKATSLNYRDLMMVEGRYNPRQALPLVVLSDAVGEVIALGDEVEGFNVGDRVCPLFAPTWHDGPPFPALTKQTLGGPLDGTLREAMAVDYQAVARVPEHLTDLEAACLPCAALTAYSALFTLGDLKAGERVLILGTGGVALFALQFARALGATVAVTSRSREKLERAKALGADVVIDVSDNPSFGERVRKELGGVEQVIEVSGTSLSDSLVAVRPGGTISLIGVLGGTRTKLELLPILMRQIRVQGVFVGHKRSFLAMVSFLQEHRIKPVVSEVFPLENYVEAFERLRGQGHFGKICIDLTR